MSKLTRRNLIAGAVAAPLTVGLGAQAPADPVLPLARTWIAERATADALMARWSDLEAEVMGEARARRRVLPQAREMRAIDRQLKRLLKKLSRDAERIAPLRATSRTGALAKIEMALAILEPVDVEEHSWGLVAAGFADLTRLAEGA
ncbi:MAG: hypothetical protein ACK4X1_14595 [Terricaulis sp.]